MRDIKFRAWDKINKEMLSGSSMYPPRDFEKAKGTSWCPFSITNRNQEDIVFLQFTGLKDKNGKEIYEGDIVKGETVELMLETDGMDDEDKKEYFNRKPNMKNSEVYWSNDDMGKWGFKPRMHLETVEVIGNIYENPELLE